MQEATPSANRFLIEWPDSFPCFSLSIVSRRRSLLKLYVTLVFNASDFSSPLLVLGDFSPFGLRNDGFLGLLSKIHVILIELIFFYYKSTLKFKVNKHKQHMQGRLMLPLSYVFTKINWFLVLVTYAPLICLLHILLCRFRRVYSQGPDCARKTFFVLIR